MTSHWRCFPAVAFWMGICFQMPRAAAAPRVVEVVEAGEGAGTTPLRSELGASGFEVIVRAGTADEVGLQQAAMATESVAAVAVIEAQAHLEARVWLTDRESRHSQMRLLLVPLDVSEPVRVVSLRVVELLHASSLELSPLSGPIPSAGLPEGAADRPVEHGGAPSRTVEAASPSQSKEASVAHSEAPPEGDVASRGLRTTAAIDGRTRAPWGLGLGASALTGPGGLSPGIAPLLSLSFRFAPSWGAQLRAIGPVLTTIENEVGSASVDYELLSLRALFEPLQASRWSPFLMGGFGAFHLGASGDARARFSSRTEHAFGASASAGAGLRIRASGRLFLVVELDATLVTPRPVVRFAGREIAKAWRPAATGGLALEVTW